MLRSIVQSGVGALEARVSYLFVVFLHFRGRREIGFEVEWRISCLCGDGCTSNLSPRDV